MSDMPKEKPLHEVMLTVSEEARKSIEAMIEGAIHFFNDDGEVPPAITCVTAQGKPHVYPAIHRNEIEKQCVWAFLRYLRETHPVVLLINEVWQSIYSGKDVHKNAEDLPRPSQDPNHTELVMISLWERERMMWIAANITRNPDKLGEFTVRFDTADEGCQMEGELTKGQSYKGHKPYGQR